MTELLGVVWGPVLHLDAVDYQDGDGVDVVLPSTLCYSVDEQMQSTLVFQEINFGNQGATVRL